MGANFGNPPCPPLEKGGRGDFERIPDWFRIGRVRRFGIEKRLLNSPLK